MDLYLLFKTLWRHKGLMILSIFAGTWIALGAAANTHTTYESSVKLMLDSPRAALFTLGLSTTESVDLRRGQQLATLCANILTSEPLVKKAERDVGPISESIAAAASVDVPIITVTVVGMDAERTQNIANKLAVNFVGYVVSAQDRYAVPREKRLIIRLLGSAAPAVPLKSRTIEIALIGFMAPVIGGAFLSFMIENIKQARRVGDKSAGGMAEQNISATKLQESTKKAKTVL